MEEYFIDCFGDSSMFNCWNTLMQEDLESEKQFMVLQFRYQHTEETGAEIKWTEWRYGEAI